MMSGSTTGDMAKDFSNSLDDEYNALKRQLVGDNNVETFADSNGRKSQPKPKPRRRSLTEVLQPPSSAPPSVPHHS